MREYGQVQLAFWTHREIQGISDQAKILAMYLLTGPHSNSLGCFRCPNGYIAEDLRWDHEIISKSFAELDRIGFVKRDEDSGWLLLPNYLRWNPIQNDNVGKKIAKLFEAVPFEVTVYKDLIEALKQHGSRLPEDTINRIETISKRFQNRIETILKPYRNNEPEPEPEPKPNSFSNEKQGLRPDLKKKTGRHFSNEVGEHRERLISVLKQFDNGRIKAVNVYAFVQKAIAKGHVHPKALVKILEQLDESWSKVKNPWAWLESRLKVENQNFNEKDFQNESAQFRSSWVEWSKSDEAKSILKHLELARPP